MFLQQIIVSLQPESFPRFCESSFPGQKPIVTSWCRLYGLSDAYRAYEIE